MEPLRYNGQSEAEAISEFKECAISMLNFLARRIPDIKFEIKIHYEDLEFRSCLPDLTFGSDPTIVEE